MTCWINHTKKSLEQGKKWNQIQYIYVLRQSRVKVVRSLFANCFQHVTDHCIYSVALFWNLVRLPSFHNKCTFYTEIFSDLEKSCFVQVDFVSYILFRLNNIRVETAGPSNDPIYSAMRKQKKYCVKWQISRYWSSADFHCLCV